MKLKLDVVGAQEAAEILGVEIGRISRWGPGPNRSNKLPPPVAEISNTNLWRRIDIEVLRDHGEWKPELVPDGYPKRPPKLKLLGLGDVAKMCVASPSQVARWRRKGQFPEPLLEKRKAGEPWVPGGPIKATPVWHVKQVAAFAKRRQERQAVAA